jgi:hypothetical protein
MFEMVGEILIRSIVSGGHDDCVVVAILILKLNVQLVAVILKVL